MISRSVYCFMVLMGLGPNDSVTATATRRLVVRVVAAVLVCLFAASGAATADSALNPTPAQLAGRVLHQRAPLDRVQIFAIETVDQNWTRTETDLEGSFLLDRLAPGLYKLIAYKAGFVPAVLMLTRGEQDEAQFVEIELGALETEDEDDFWSARRHIPGDVLREIELAQKASNTPADASIQNPIRPVRTRVQAFAGTDDRIAGSAVTGGSLALDGQLGSARIAVSGDFREFGSEREEVGSTQAVTVAVGSGGNDVEVTILRHDLDGTSPGDEVALERHAVGWSRDFGRAGRSQVRAEYTEQRGFYEAGDLGAVAPNSSRAFELQAEHTTELTAGHTLTAGINYREAEALPGSLNPSLEPGQRIDLYSQGGVRVQPRVLVQYGLVTTLYDGAVSFVPRGGAVLRINDRWTASTLAAQRVYSDDVDVFGFRPVLADNYSGCQSGQKACYQVELAREVSDDRRFSIAATHREFDETLQLLFDEDLLDRLDTVYLVAGDQLPELAISYKTHWRPGIWSRIESSLAIGGGGRVMSVADPLAENSVQYLVTSVDTQFERSDTGLYVAFQQLQQSVQGRTLSPLDLDKLQLRLTQDLKSLIEVADIAVNVNYELARGFHPTEPDRPADEVRQRLTGGVALSF